MNTLARSCAKPITPSSRERVSVTVVYHGRDDFHTDLPDVATLRQLKLLALVHFGLQPDAVDCYVLRNHATNCLDEQNLAELGGGLLRSLWWLPRNPVDLAKRCSSVEKSPILVREGGRKTHRLAWAYLLTDCLRPYRQLTLTTTLN